MTKVLCVIPARRGSKRVKRKNIRILDHKPLISYSVNEALKSNRIDRVVISTDDEVISGMYPDISLERPPELSGDDVPTIDVVKHIESLVGTYDYKVILEPTTPFRTYKDIDKCIDMCIKNNLDSVVSVVQVKNFYCYIPNGAVFVYKNDIYINKNMGLYVMPEEQSIDIDTEYDFAKAEGILKVKKNEMASTII